MARRNSALTRLGDSRIALGRQPNQLRTWSDLIRTAETIGEAVKLTETRRPALCCSDRFWLSASLLACWRHSCIPILPPSWRLPVLNEVCRLEKVDVLLHDGVLGSQGVDTSQLPTKVGSPDRALSFVYHQLVSRRGQEPLVTLYTSGSTGEPLRCAKTAGQLLGEAELLVDTFDLAGDIVVLSSAPACHIYGLLFSVLVPMIGGGAFVRETIQSPETLVELATNLNPNVFCSVPPHLQRLASIRSPTFPRFRRIFSSGGNLSSRVGRDVQGRLEAPVIDVLGSTETGGIAYRISGISEHYTPLPGISVYAGEQDELLLDSPLATPQGPGPVRTADRVIVNDDGTFLHLGRADSVVKVGATRVSLTEVERQLLQLEGVLDAAVVALPVAGVREHEVCAVVVAPNQSEAQLRQTLSTYLDMLAIPRRFLFVESLPRQGNGKLARDQLIGLLQ